MARPHQIDRVEPSTLASGQQSPQIQARDRRQDGEYATLCLHARDVAVGTEQTAALERRERAAVAVLPDAIEDDIEPAWQDARKVLALEVDRRGVELAHNPGVLAARSTPQLEAGHSAQRQQRLTDGTHGSLHEHALAALDPGRAVQELVGGRPAQD